MPTYYRTSWVPQRFYTAPVYAPARPLYIETPPAGTESTWTSLKTGALIGGAAAIVLLLLTSGTKRRRVEV